MLLEFLGFYFLYTEYRAQEHHVAMFFYYYYIFKIRFESSVLSQVI